MSDDLVKQAIAELQDVVRCRCHPAFTDRGLHDPSCECDSADAVKVVSDRIEELEAELADAENRANAFATKEMHTAKDRCRLQWALQELDTDPAITVAEHVQEDNRLAPFLPRSAAAVAEARAALQDTATDTAPKTSSNDASQ